MNSQSMVRYWPSFFSVCLIMLVLFAPAAGFGGGQTNGPPLGIEFKPTAASLSLVWPATWTNLQVEATTRLSPAIGWAPLTNQVSILGRASSGRPYHSYRSRPFRERHRLEQFRAADRLRFRAWTSYWRDQSV